MWRFFLVAFLLIFKKVVVFCSFNWVRIWRFLFLAHISPNYYILITELSWMLWKGLFRGLVYGRLFFRNNFFKKHELSMFAFVLLFRFNWKTQIAQMLCHLWLFCQISKKWLYFSCSRRLPIEGTFSSWELMTTLLQRAVNGCQMTFLDAYQVRASFSRLLQPWILPSWRIAGFQWSLDQPTIFWLGACFNYIF